jgi:hypothetical protein
MSDEDKLRAATARASRAQALVNDDLLTEAFDTLEREYTKAWRETAVRDNDARERLWQAVNVASKVREHLRRLVSDGTLAQREIDMLADKQRPFPAPRGF